MIGTETRCFYLFTNNLEKENHEGLAVRMRSLSEFQFGHVISLDVVLSLEFISLFVTSCHKYYAVLVRDSLLVTSHICIWSWYFLCFCAFGHSLSEFGERFLWTDTLLLTLACLFTH